MPSFREQISRVVTWSKPYLGGGALVAASFCANFLNFFFNAYLGRHLEFEHFAAISLVGSFSYLSTLISKGFGTTVTFQVGYFTGKNELHSAFSYWRFIRRYSFFFSLLITIAWIVFSPFLSTYFNTDDIFLFVLFSLVFLVGFSLTVDQAFLSGRLLFGAVATLILFESILKNILAFLFVTLDFPQFAYAIVPLSTLTTFFVGWVMVRLSIQSTIPMATDNKTKITHTFPFKFFSISMLLGLSSLAFLSFDVILVKHFLSPVEAGQYSLISLVGKMIYFFAGLASLFILPITSRNEGAKSDSHLVFYLSLAATALLSLAIYIPLGPLAEIFVPILYGEKALSITQYLPAFGIGIVCFSLSKIFISYYLVKKIYSFAFSSFLLTLTQITLMFWFHENIGQIVTTMCAIGMANLALVVLLHTFGNFTQKLERKTKHLIRKTSKRVRSHSPRPMVAALIKKQARNSAEI